jgi:hypothetical protein
MVDPLQLVRWQTLCFKVSMADGKPFAMNFMSCMMGFHSVTLGAGPNAILSMSAF